MNRYEYLRDVKRLPVQLLAVDDVLRFGDMDFATYIAKDEDCGAEYLKFVANRNKLKRKACKHNPAIRGRNVHTRMEHGSDEVDRELRNATKR